MTDLDKQARELLAAGYRKRGCHLHADRVIQGVSNDDVALSTIRAALTTAPAGFVLVPVEPTEAMLDAATDHDVGGHCHMCSIWACSEGDAATIWAAMLTAAKEALT